MRMADNRHEDCRERVVGATLNLCTSRGYEATTVAQIVAAADVSLSDFERHFATKDAVIMSIVDDLLGATATALGDVETDIEPEHALLIATISVLGAIVKGGGVISRDRMLAMGRIVATTPGLRHQASAARKRVLAPALAKRLGVGWEDRRVQRAVTMWSAIAVAAHIGQLSVTLDYDPRQDESLSERMIASLSGTFAQVMGRAPGPEA